MFTINIVVKCCRKQGKIGRENGKFHWFVHILKMAETKKKETREQIILHTPEALWVDQRDIYPTG
jgi:hypothetical protein